MKNPKFIDLYFSTPNRESLLADLAGLDLRLVITDPDGVQQLVTGLRDADGNGHALDYVGRLERAAAKYDTTQSPPIMVTPPDYCIGEYANLRLFGPAAEARAVPITTAKFEHGTKVLPAPNSPKRRWA